MKHIILVLLILAAVVSCTHSIHSSRSTGYTDANGKNVPLQRTSRIAVSKKKDVILGISYNTNYVDDAYEELLSRCPDGEIVGVQVRHYTNLKFLSYTDNITIQARCVK